VRASAPVFGRWAIKKGVDPAATQPLPAGEILTSGKPGTARRFLVSSLTRKATTRLLFDFG
jgi:hypothetical protein